jgi:hypothetical protein
LRAQGTQDSIAIFDDCVEIWNARLSPTKPLVIVHTIAFQEFPVLLLPHDGFANGATRGGGVPPPCQTKLCSPISFLSAFPVADATG